MKRSIFLKISLVLLCLLMLVCSVSCDNGGEAGGGKPNSPDGATKLSFKSASSYDYLKTLDGKKVTINGYLATSSPVDGSFIFLMNLPLQSCPFCVPNTTELSNTIEVYPKSGEKFDYTNQAVQVVGTLEVAPDKNKPFTDPYGYQFNFKIVDATYTILKAEDMSENMAQWQKISSTDVVNDVYKMYDFVHFVCSWNTYSVKSWTDVDGKVHPGYYLYAADAINYLTKDGAQWNYGYKEVYFDAIIAEIKKIDATAYDDLVKNIEAAKALSEKAIKELMDGNYTYEHKYVEEFGTYDDIYTINKGEELMAEWQRIYTDFSDWLGSWEL